MAWVFTGTVRIPGLSYLRIYFDTGRNVLVTSIRDVFLEPMVSRCLSYSLKQRGFRS